MNASRPAGRPAARPLVAAAALVLLIAGCRDTPPGEAPPDEAMVRAMAEGKTAEQAAVDYFKPKQIVDYFPAMDAVAPPGPGSCEGPDQLLDRRGRRPRAAEPLRLTDQEAFGRNAWMIWCAGNEGFWDWLANHSYGSSDLLKLLDSRTRGTRFRDAGLINEPGIAAPGAPEATDFGLWLGVPSDPKLKAARSAYLTRAFEAARRGKLAPGYGGSGGDGGAYDSYGEGSPPPPEVYGLPSGVIGLRLFPNPKFDEAAREAWDPRRYYDDPDYYRDPKLVRPFRVGMSCAFCHTSFHPLDPPRDVTDPAWRNLSGNIGAQYLRIRAVFGNLMGPESFVYHVLDSQPPGTIDTSLIPSDNINNTNAMNAIFGVPGRLALSFRNPAERLNPPGAGLPSTWTDQEIAADDDKVPGELRAAIPDLPGSNGNPRRVPRILLDGADSIGAFGALSRVFLNIGSYYEQWIRIHEPLVGFRPQQPFRIADCQARSVAWNATSYRIGPLRDYFLRITPPMKLLDAKSDVDRTAPVDEAAIHARAKAEELDPGPLLAAERARRVDLSKLAQGRRAFARNCIVCHSSVQSPERVKAMEAAVDGEFWDHDPGRWLADPDYLAWAEAQVETPEFWRDNYLSTDYRVPIQLVRTNSARAMATNALAGHMWGDFSSADYQKLPSVGAIPFFNPYLGKSGGMDRYQPRHKAPEGAPAHGGGPGFYRVPSLISIWATAPLLHNNSLGLFNNDPSVDGRLLAFDDAIRKLLWPERRVQSSSYNEATPERLARDHGLIWRTPRETHLTLPARVVPQQVFGRVAAAMRLVDRFPWLADVRQAWLPVALVALSFLGLWLYPKVSMRPPARLALPAAGLAIGLVGSSLIGGPGWLAVPAVVLILMVAAARLSSGLFSRVAFGYLPLGLELLIGLGMFFADGRLGDVRVGPIPKGTPVNLLANLNPDADPADVQHAVGVTIRTLSEIESRHLGEAEAQAALRERVAPELMKVSRCPDFVMDQGHDFAWFKGMTDDDKDALIELLKTF